MSGFTITTKFHGPTNFLGSRISAKVRSTEGYWDETKQHYERIYRSSDHSMGILERHAAVAMELANKVGMVGEWIIGETDDGTGYIFVRRRGGEERLNVDGLPVAYCPEAE